MYCSIDVTPIIMTAIRCFPFISIKLQAKFTRNAMYATLSALDIIVKAYIVD